MATKASPVTEREYRALAALRYAVRRFLTFSEAAARAAGIEPQQHQLLLALKGLPADTKPTIRVVAERLQLRHNSVVELVQRAVARGFVVRAESEEDRREALLHILPPGERVLEDLTIAHRTELRSAGPELARAIDELIGRPRAPKAKAKAAATNGPRRSS